VKIEDNFLDQNVFGELQTLMMGHDFDWHYNDIIDYVEDKDKFMFFHLFYAGSVPISSFIEQLNPILEILNPVSLWRIKANLLTKTPTIVENEFHHDIDSFDDENRKTIFPKKLEQWTTSIFYVNSNNGYTKFEDGTKVESVANRMATFPANLKHTGTSCTDEKTRVVVNFNYFK
jgi:hypothetical protein